MDSKRLMNQGVTIVVFMFLVSACGKQMGEGTNLTEKVDLKKERSGVLVEDELVRATKTCSTSAAKELYQTIFKREVEVGSAFNSSTKTDCGPTLGPNASYVANSQTCAIFPRVKIVNSYGCVMEVQIANNIVIDLSLDASPICNEVPESASRQFTLTNGSNFFLLKYEMVPPEVTYDPFGNISNPNAPWRIGRSYANGTEISDAFSTKLWNNATQAWSDLIVNAQKYNECLRAEIHEGENHG